MNHRDKTVVVIGGGFYGCMLALHFKKALRARKVMVLELEERLLSRASWINQARVHRGYHYPRDWKTAKSSAVSYERFVYEFKDCILSDVHSIYAISRNNSKISARRFEAFCKSIGAPLRDINKCDCNLFKSGMIDKAYKVDEVLFSADEVRSKLEGDLQTHGVEVRLCHAVSKVAALGDYSFLVEFDYLGSRVEIEAGVVLNCTYSCIDSIEVNGKISNTRLIHKLTEVALIEPQDELKGTGVTIMDGPFFSTLPAPVTGLHSLTHVRYSHHQQWSKKKMTGINDRNEQEDVKNAQPRSLANHMLKDAERYIPSFRNARYMGSLYEIKTFSQSRSLRDARPIWFRKEHRHEGIYSILGGKIDNVYDIIDTIGALTGFEK